MPAMLPPRRLLLTLAVGVLAALPASAGAAVVGGGATGPTGSVVDTLNPGANVLVTGSALVDSPQPTVQVGCYQEFADGSVGGVLLGTPSLNAGDGSFSLSLTRVPFGCLLSPRPSTFTAAGFGGFTGTIPHGSERTVQPIGSGPNASQIREARFSVSGASAEVETLNGAVSGMDVITKDGPLPKHSNELFLAGGSLPDYQGSGRTAVLVDGHNAFTGPDLAGIDDTTLGLKGVTVDFERLTTDGSSLATTLSMPLVDCRSDPCIPTGVTLTRASSTNGASLTIRDTWRSTDGNAHTIDALEDTELDGGPSGFSFPWVAGGLKTYPSAAQIPPAPNSVFTIGLERTHGSADVAGAITVSAKPDVISIPASNALELRWKRNVPAGGSAAFTTTYAMGATSGAVAPISAAAEAAAAADGPKVSFTSGTTSSQAAYTATGTASAGAGIASVTVNGVAATVASDGTWSAPLTLAKGANPITATIIDANGDTASASTTVTFDAVGAAAAAKAAAASFGGKATFKGGTLTVTVGCTGTPGQACSVGLLLATQGATSAAKKKARTTTLVRRTLLVPAGAPRAFKVKLPKSALKRLPRKGALKATLTLSQTLAGGTATKRYALKLRR